MVCVVAFSTLVPSCSGMNDLSDKFLKEGEIIYAAMPDTVEFGSGDHRVKFLVHMNTNRVQKVRIYWNDGGDSLDMEVGNRTGVFPQVVEGLEERSYVFQLVSFDKYGNKSLEYEVYGASYGQNYVNSFLDRNVVSVAVNGSGDKILRWGDIDTSSLDAKYNELRYTNSAGEHVVLKVPFTDRETTLTDLKQGTNVEYRTAYVPDDMAIDTFYTEYREFVLSDDGYFAMLKDGWKLLKYSDQVNGDTNNVASNAIDGNTKNRWHSASNAYPHWLTIDFGETVNVGHFRLWPSVYDLSAGQAMDTRLCSKFKLFVTNTAPAGSGAAEIDAWDADTSLWMEIGEFSNISTQAEPQTYDFPAVDARYMKFVGTAAGVGDANYMVLGELDVLFR